jgi:predicted DNA-binding transcriptional regulator AlpA
MYSVGMDRLLHPSHVAEILSVTERALAAWRSQGAGPPFVRLGHRTVRYRETELAGWVNAQESASEVPESMNTEGTR